MTAQQLLDDSAFFAPAPTDLLDNLLAQYRQQRENLEEIAGVLSSERFASVMHYFLEGNHEQRERIATDPRKLFSLDGAIAALNAHFWQRALDLTDVMDYMPQGRRSEWHEQIRAHDTPEFDEQTVRSTLMNLLQMREQFLAEKIDGLFRALSGEHVTNRPQAFGSRMIMYVREPRLGINCWRSIGHLTDLRSIIARMMGRDEVRHGSTDSVVRAAYEQVGEWVELDGGALRMRVYRKGTAHLEVHPDLAWRLNAILATLHPSAIPESLRRKPVKRKPSRVWRELQQPLPFYVIEALTQMEKAQDLDARENKQIRFVPRTRVFRYSVSDKRAREDAGKVLGHIGGVWCDRYYAFDYEPDAVIDEIITSGLIPDIKSHQYYPTPEHIAREAVERAEIGPEHRCLEPSAGTGALVQWMPPEQTLCVEVSKLHCSVLRARGYRCRQEDFLRFAAGKQAGRYDRVVMNPPFSEGRWQHHLDTAAGLLTPGGRLVAILPASAQGKELLPGWQTQWSQVYQNDFRGISVSVVMLIADKP